MSPADEKREDPTESPEMLKLLESVDLSKDPQKVIEESQRVADAQRLVWGLCGEGFIDLHEPIRGGRDLDGDAIVVCAKCGAVIA